MKGICLPQLDGSVEATVARLDAWAAKGDTDVFDAVEALHETVCEAVDLAQAHSKKALVDDTNSIAMDLKRDAHDARKVLELGLARYGIGVAR